MVMRYRAKIKLQQPTSNLMLVSRDHENNNDETLTRVQDQCKYFSSLTLLFLCFVKTCIRISLVLIGFVDGNFSNLFCLVVIERKNAYTYIIKKA